MLNVICLFSDYGESRYLTLGLLHGKVTIIATAETDKTIRIISMRKADKNEQRIYY
ncbi:MAG: BrnT family toxin, partial [Nitrosospira sp.]|nr:BrnT family toxin [Nitrosospira sp.]